MDPPSFTKNVCKDELRISDQEFNKFQKVMKEIETKISEKLQKEGLQDAAAVMSEEE